MAALSEKAHGGGLALVRLAKEEGLLDDLAALEITALSLGIEPVAEIDPLKIPSQLLEAVPIQFAKRNKLVPFKESNDSVVVAFSDPKDIKTISDLRVLYGRPVKAALAPEHVILDATNRAYEMGSGDAGDLMEGIAEKGLDELAHELEEPKDLLDADDEAPVIRLVNGILFQAVKDRASDIHLEPYERELAVRYRIDGMLYKVLSPPRALQAPIVSRVKIMAGLDIAEKRLPQDGRIRIKLAGKDIDIRVSVLPTAFGERVVMRLLDKTSVVLRLEDLGLGGTRLEAFKNLITKPNGIILSTGPTGSGKTTTLYSALSRINSEDINIITVEDPIEYQIRGIGQIQVNPKIDLTFAAGLRSILRQDPDVIMVGEIRDPETAEIAIQSSLTGHLVFSTLHTNDASSAVTRLIEMGIEPFLVSSSILAILAQRLVRKLCPTCREPYTPEDAELSQLGIAREALPEGVLYRAMGCDECKNTGYKGRTGIYELLVLADAVRSHITSNADASTIKRAAMKAGMLTLREDGAKKAAAGITSASEVIRVTQEEE
ncbi:MAG: type II secretion system protein GspE [Deltaproteobacteria bacterium]|nr:MAG: type II secretion system protein GspE [Deltaproteobacteria bacterium]